jgi:hypothetical protein
MARHDHRAVIRQRKHLVDRADHSLQRSPAPEIDERRRLALQHVPGVYDVSPRQPDQGVGTGVRRRQMQQHDRLPLEVEGERVNKGCVRQCLGSGRGAMPLELCDRGVARRLLRQRRLRHDPRAACPPVRVALDVIIVIMGVDDQPHREGGNRAERRIGERSPTCALAVHQQQSGAAADDEDSAVGVSGDHPRGGGDRSDHHDHRVLGPELRQRENQSGDAGTRKRQAHGVSVINRGVPARTPSLDPRFRARAGLVGWERGA